MRQLDLFENRMGMVRAWTVKIQGRTISYTLKRSTRARNVWLRIGIGTGLEVVAPSNMPIDKLDGILAEKASWIERHVIQKPGLTKKIENNNNYYYQHKVFGDIKGNFPLGNFRFIARLRFQTRTKTYI